MNPEVSPPGWRPVFIDYLYVGLTNATAFSPTDAMPLAPWANVTARTEKARDRPRLRQRALTSQTRESPRRSSGTGSSVSSAYVEHQKAVRALVAEYTALPASAPERLAKRTSSCSVLTGRRVGRLLGPVQCA